MSGFWFGDHEKLVVIESVTAWGRKKSRTFNDELLKSDDNCSIMLTIKYISSHFLAVGTQLIAFSESNRLSRLSFIVLRL